MLYHMYEVQHAAISPMRMMATAGHKVFSNPLNPMSYTQQGRMIAAGCDVFNHITRRHGKPSFGFTHTNVNGVQVPVREEDVLVKSFCKLKRFVRQGAGENDPRILMVAPMSGHFATLLRGTVEALLPDHDVYITDWTDARDVPLQYGHFDLDSYIAYLMDFMRFLGPNTHLIAVCQPSVPVMAATSLLATANDANQPASMTLMGGPIDTRENPTEVNRYASEKSLQWFESNVISRVPYPNAGVSRRVYPGFLQLAGFMSMNWNRHVEAHQDMFTHLVEGDGESAEAKRSFYEEYLAVMDLTAEFFLQTIETVFHEHALPNGTMTWNGIPVDPSAITDTALMTVEGEKDDITGMGQTKAAHKLCSNLDASKKQHHLQPGVGHYGVFNGRKFREQIRPRIAAFIREHDREGRGRDSRTIMAAE